MKTTITNPVSEKYANLYMYSDVEPYEIIRQLSDSRIEIREMRAELIEDSAKKLQESFVPGGFLGHTNNSLQEYAYTPDTGNETMTIRKHKNNYWYGPSGSLHILANEPRKFYDYNF